MRFSAALAICSFLGLGLLLTNDSLVGGGQFSSLKINEVIKNENPTIFDLNIAARFAKKEFYQPALFLDLVSYKELPEKKRAAYLKKKFLYYKWKDSSRYVLLYTLFPYLIRFLAPPLLLFFGPVLLDRMVRGAFVKNHLPLLFCDLNKDPNITTTWGHWKEIKDILLTAIKSLGSFWSKDLNELLLNGKYLFVWLLGVGFFVLFPIYLCIGGFKTVPVSLLKHRVLGILFFIFFPFFILFDWLVFVATNFYSKIIFPIQLQFGSLLPPDPLEALQLKYIAIKIDQGREKKAYYQVMDQLFIKAYRSSPINKELVQRIAYGLDLVYTTSRYQPREVAPKSFKNVIKKLTFLEVYTKEVREAVTGWTHRFYKNKETPILAFIGPPGTGKTFTAIFLSKQLSFKPLFLDLTYVTEANVNSFLQEQLIAHYRKTGSPCQMIVIDEGPKIIRDKPFLMNYFINLLDSNTKVIHFNSYHLTIDRPSIWFIGNSLVGMDRALIDRLKLVPSGFTSKGKSQVIKEQLPKICDRIGISYQSLTKRDKMAIAAIERSCKEEKSIRPVLRKIESYLESKDLTSQE